MEARSPTALDISTAPNRFKECYAPVFKVRCNGTPYHAGTAFAFENEGQSWLVTAAHVFDKDDNNPCDTDNQLFLVVAGELRQLRIFHRLQLKEKTSTLDIAIVEPKEFSVKSAFTNALSHRDVYPRPLDSQHYAAACGFPSTKNKVRHGTRMLTRRPYGYFGKIGKAARLRRAGFSPQTHFCIDILLKKTFTRTQREVKAPSPYGISGGPVFLVHDFQSPRASTQSKLIGMVIEKTRDRRHLICVDIRPALQAAFGSSGA